VFIVHGETDAVLALKSKLDAELQVKSYIPRLFEIVEIPLES
jgi:hypothetical protein